MSAAVAEPGPLPPRAPSEVRAALLPEEVGQFDSEWRRAMARAAEDLDLSEVYTTLSRWRVIATMTSIDPEAHRRMLRRAADALAGAPPPPVAADDLRALIESRLGR